MKGYNKLSEADKKVLQNFNTDFAKNNDKVTVVAVKPENTYLRVTLSDGDWLHVIPYGWY